MPASNWNRFILKLNIDKALGVCYVHGYGVPKDMVEAAKWYKAAADQGDALAKEALKKIAVEVPVPVDAEAQYNLGLRYAQGNGAPKDMTEAVKWYRKAADQGHAMGQFLLGLCYYQGEGVKKDAVKAVQWFRLAALQGHAGAQFALGVCYAHGDGVPEDKTEAAKWYKMAGEQTRVGAREVLKKIGVR